MWRSLTGLLSIVLVIIFAIPLLHVNIDELPQNNVTPVENINTADETEMAEDRAFFGESDDKFVTRTISYPRLIFGQDEPYFEQHLIWSESPAYAVLDFVEGYRFDVVWYALWENDVAAGVEIEANVAVKLSDTDEFEDWGGGYDYIERVGPASHEAVLPVYLYFDEPGYYEIELELMITAFLEDQEPAIYDDRFYLTVHVLENTEDSEDTFEAAHPILDFDAANEGFLLDWRAWHNGSCDIETFENELQLQFENICHANNDQDFDLARNLLADALNTTEDPLWWATILDQLAINALLREDWYTAFEHFLDARNLWADEGNAFWYGVALHNHAVLALALGELELADEDLTAAVSIREQLNDFVGIALTTGQIAVKQHDLQAVEEVAVVLAEEGYPQGEGLFHWLDEQ